MKVACILPSAGLGIRMRPASPEKTGTSRKQFMLLDGSPILMHTVRKFLVCPLVGEIFVSLRQEDLEWVGQFLEKERPTKPVHLVEGGDSRQQSVENALASISSDTDLVAVHDAVRPFVDQDTLVKQVHLTKIRATLPRERLVLAQTPQVFRLALLREAFARARKDNFNGTDESSLVERLETVEVSVVLGSDRNIKITKPSDMELARFFLAEEAAQQKAS
jgi:2-C-methyl-D-erythritol 4-phosphate cytidylyltransferase